MDRSGDRKTAPVRRLAIPLRPNADDLVRPGPGAELFNFGGGTMGTTWSIRFYAPEGFTPGHLLSDIDALFARYTRQMSLWEPDSDIARFNRAASGAWVDLPDPFFSILTDAAAIAEETGGAFDPTLGALAERWGFGPSFAETAPGEADIAALRAQAGWRRLELEPERKRVRQPGGLTLDLNAIAKGDAVDALGGTMDAAGLRVWLAEIGGELRGRGSKPDGSPWWVQLETGPDGPSAPESGERETFVAVSGRAIATSGAYRRRRMTGTGSVCHTIDPASGEAMGMGLHAVSVLAETCRRADALATALFVMGPQRGGEFAAARGVAAIFTHEGGETLTPAFAQMLEP